MWFTQVSLKNPVFATMVMLAIVVLGLFSYQRLKIDQFPNIEFPVVVVTVSYPGAAPEIVESEVTKKIEESVNSIAGIDALTSRSYEGMAVVIIEFQLHVDGTKAAEDVRERGALGAPAVPPRGQGPARAALCPAQPRRVVPGRAARGAGRWQRRPPCGRWQQAQRGRVDHLGRAGSQEAAGKRARCGRGALGRTHPARDQHLPEPAGARSLCHHARAGGRGGAQREPEPARGPDPLPDAGPRGADRRAHAAPRRLRPDHRRAPQWRAGAPEPGSARARWRPGARKPGAVQRPAHLAAGGAKVAGREHHRGG